MSSAPPVQTQPQTIILNGIDPLGLLLDATIKPAVEIDLNQEDWKQIINVIEEEHDSFFDRDAGPDGEEWPALAPYTVAKKGHATILEEDRLLRQSLTESGAQHAIRETTLAELIFGTDRDDAWKHQDGYGKIPRRSHTGFSDNLVDEVADLVADIVVGKMVKANL